jgi:hypothetical protein
MAALRDSLSISIKVKQRVAIWPRNSDPKVIPKRIENLGHKILVHDIHREDPRLQLEHKSRQHELHESKTLLRHWNHTWWK